MADKIVPRDYAETAGVPAAARKEIWNPDTGNNEYVEHQKEFEDGLYLSEGEIAIDKYKSTTLSADGWYTIAESNAEANGVYAVDFQIVSTGGSARRNSLSASLHVVNDGNAVSEAHIKIKNRSNANKIFYLKGIRLAYSKSVASSGIKVQINIDQDTGIALKTIMSNNNSILPSTSATAEGLKLIEPTQIDVGLLPDGVTSADFIEAGEELKFPDSTTLPLVNWTAYKGSSDDIIRCMIDWGQIPKQGTQLAITLPSTSLNFRGGGEQSANLSTYTITNFAIQGNLISFLINQTGIAANLTDLMPYHAISSGSAGNGTILTIED